MYAMVMSPPSAPAAPQPSAPSTIDVALHRSPDQRWGFRLQGGADYRTQLTVMRVEPNSPAQGKLRVGDAIQTVNGKKSRQLSHAQASEVIKESGNSLKLTIVREPNAAACLDHIRPPGKPKFSRPGS
ncbi:hypothetical protein BOX15_Mlig010807g1 [Macrostomum lignano]|uniref:PDZ domain-containing protein n=1 Tax=Macrostomum lignano TaxID=282301 RepID=A0A267EHT1_9PLAT|nr:hypothetical protein BOX15_Mlig010807g1 [Macrostomum lignano]